MSYIDITAKTGVKTVIGRTGENNARRVLFPVVAEFTEQVGAGGAFGILYKRAGDTGPYAVTTTVSGGNLVWVVANTDVAKAGDGACQITYTIGTVVAKSERYVMRTEEGIAGSEQDPPEPWQDWVTQVLQAGATATTKASEASASATAAEGSASSASGSASSASASAVSASGYASNASTSATLAGASASEAGLSATAAQTAATNAGNSATAASGSASSASASAVSAGESATTAQTAATNAGNSATQASGSASSASDFAVSAGESATTAQTAATNAGNSATQASGSASAAGASATLASEYADSASASAESAEGSASSAAGSATAAGNSATAAAGSASTAQTAAGQAQAVLAGAVRFDQTQNLTEEQKQQARDNIGAGTGGGGTTDHAQLTNRDASGQHPISAITGLQSALDGKQPTISDLEAIRNNASAGAGKVSCTDETVGGFGYTKTPKPDMGTINISASWTGSSSPYTQTVTVTGATVTENSKVDLLPSAGVIAQMINDNCNALYISNNNGVLTLYAVGAGLTVAQSGVQVCVTEVTA